MKLSARNTFKGKVTHIDNGAVTTEVTIELPGGMEIISIIARQSAIDLRLATGKVAYAVINAANVVIGVDS
jgi:molybdopterin-binding protein